MSDHIHPAPQAPQPIATPAPAPTADAHNFSRPGTTNAVAPNHPATGPAPTTFPPTTSHNATTEEHQTLNGKLNTADRYWKFKTVFQTIAIIIDLIGIGTMGWLVSTASRDEYYFGLEAFFELWPTLITFSISFAWCIVCILVLVIRKRPVHPGARVAMELLLWLAFIATALFATAALLDLLNWGEYGNVGSGYGYSSSSGNYELAANGTWVWDSTSGSTSSTRDCDRNSSSTSYYYESAFKNCAEQDAYLNRIWSERPHRSNVELTGVVCQYFALILHLALFIWACVDCNHYNRSKVSKDAEKIAANIVQTMITNGAVVPPPGQAHLGQTWGQPQMGYYQSPQQQAYPHATMYPQGMQTGQPGQEQSRAPQAAMGSAAGPVAGSSSEKSHGPRYA